MLIAANILLDLAMVLQVLAVLALHSLPAFASFWLAYPTSVVVVIITKYRARREREASAAAAARYEATAAVSFFVGVVCALAMLSLGLVNLIRI